MTLRKKTPINGKVTNGIDVKIPPNLSHMFEKMTDQVLCREIIPELKRRATEYQQWIFDEQKKAEQILKDSGHMPPRIRTAINPWRDDFLNLLAAIDVSGGNDECSATDKNLCEHKVRFESNSSEHWKTKLSPPNDLSHLSTTIAEGVRDFCVRRTANALCRKRKMLETVADKTRKFRENSQRRVKQRKKKLEKESEERRKQSLSIIKQKALNATANKERKLRAFSCTPIAKRTRSAHNSTPIAKRLRSKTKVNENAAPTSIMQEHRGRIKTMKKAEKKEALHCNPTTTSAFLAATDTNQIASTKCNSETEILSKFETAIPEGSNVNATSPFKFKHNMPQMDDSVRVVTAVLNSDEDTEQDYIEFGDVPRPRHASQPLTWESFPEEGDDASTDRINDSLSTSIRTASILERTRPGNKNSDIARRSACAISGDTREVDSDSMIHRDVTRRSTRLFHDLKYARSTAGDDLRVIPMDLNSSSSCQSETMAAHTARSDVAKAKRAKVTSTKFPGRKTLDELEEPELTSESMKAVHQSSTNSISSVAEEDIKARIRRVEEDETDRGIYDVLSNDTADFNEMSLGEIPSWANEANLRQILEKQQMWILTNVDALFGKIHPPDMQKMFGNTSKIRSRRSSSAVWESPIWNPRVGYSAYHLTFQQPEKRGCSNVRRSQRVKKPVSYHSYF